MLLPVEDDKRVEKRWEGPVFGWPRSNWYRVLMLQLKDLRVGQWEEPCIGLTQENSIENSIQDSLPYIPWTHGPC